MRASLDTNVIIHLYKAGLQSVLFDVFDKGVFIYEQIRNVELENHGRDVLETVDADIVSGKIEIYTDQRLKDVLILRYFMGVADESQTVKDFDAINTAAGLNWAFRSQLSRFIRRFLKDPYREEDTIWIREFEKKYGIKLKEKLQRLSKLV